MNGLVGVAAAQTLSSSALALQTEELADPNWNVVAVVDSTGSVVERMKYDAFGKITWSNANGYDWNRTFTGQVFDSETDLMPYRKRFYHTELGRFITRDPVWYDSGDVNLMRYVANSPFLNNDPIGNTMGRGEQWFHHDPKPKPPKPGPTPRQFSLSDSKYAEYGQPCICPGNRKKLAELAGGELSVPTVPGDATKYGSTAGNGSVSSGYPGYIGAAGVGTCVGVVVYCPDTDTVYTYHLGAGKNRAGISFQDHGKGCRAVLCQGNEGTDSRISRCLLHNTINALKSQGVTIDGFIPESGCYIGPDKKWYGTGKR